VGLVEVLNCGWRERGGEVGLERPREGGGSISKNLTGSCLLWCAEGVWEHKRNLLS